MPVRYSRSKDKPLITLRDAKARYGVPISKLTPLILGELNGDPILPEEEALDLAIKQNINRESFQHLDGQEITMQGAARKYSVSFGTIRKWKERKWAAVLRDTGHRGIYLNEADVAYCVALLKAGYLRHGKRNVQI